MEEIEPRRARRRRLTRQVAARRRHIHLGTVHPDGEVDCVCELADTYFADQFTFCKSGRKRLRGQPRLGRCCGEGGRTRIYRWRAQRRELQHLIIRQRAAADGDAVSLLASPVIVDW